MGDGALPGRIRRKRCRIGIDVGGTFTDFVLANRSTGELTHYKEPSTPSDPSLSVHRGVPLLLERAGVGPGDVELIVHGTTLLLNAIIQHRGAKVALVVSKGHRGIIEIARARLPNSYSFRVRKEEPLVSRDLVFETGARIMFDGTVIGRPEPGEIEAIAKGIKAAQAEAVTVLLLHSYAHTEMEAQVGAELRRHLPGIPVTESARVWPERREFERSQIAVMNAFSQPLFQTYLALLAERVRDIGVTAPIYITANNGGTLSIDSARERPIDTVLSGPASGVVAANRTTRASGHAKIITVDMGGTSCDVGVTKGLEPEFSMQTHVGNYPLAMPVVAVSSIGAGGGSVVWVDAQGILKVGPRSAGADPGPLCYGRGGKEPTITDCYLLVGLINPDHFLGGRMKLNAEAARLALEAIADRIGIEGPDRAVKAAEAALRVATATMSTELFKEMAGRGEDPREFALMAFGGAGPTHANLLAEEARLRTIIVPRAPATFCAMGAILADVKRDYVRTKLLKFADGATTVERLAEIFRDLEGEASRWINTEGDTLGRIGFTAALDMRYQGQAFDLQVPVPDAVRRKPKAASITELFHREHEKVYGFRESGTPIEITTVRLRITGKIPPIRLPTIPSGKRTRPRETRRVYHRGRHVAARVYDRGDLGLDDRIKGPAVVEQEATTVWILPGWAGAVDRIGNLVLRVDGGATKPRKRNTPKNAGSR